MYSCMFMGHLLEHYVFGKMQYKLENVRRA